MTTLKLPSSQVLAERGLKPYSPLEIYDKLLEIESSRSEPQLPVWFSTPAAHGVLNAALLSDYSLLQLMHGARKKAFMGQVAERIGIGLREFGPIWKTFVGLASYTLTLVTQDSHDDRDRPNRPVFIVVSSGHTPSLRGALRNAGYLNYRRVEGVSRAELSSQNAVSLDNSKIFVQSGIDIDTSFAHASGDRLPLMEYNDRFLAERPLLNGRHEQFEAWYRVFSRGEPNDGPLTATWNLAHEEYLRNTDEVDEQISVAPSIKLAIGEFSREHILQNPGKDTFLRGLLTPVHQGQGNIISYVDRRVTRFETEIQLYKPVRNAVEHLLDTQYDDSILFDSNRHNVVNTGSVSELSEDEEHQIDVARTGDLTAGTMPSAVDSVRDEIHSLCRALIQKLDEEAQSEESQTSDLRLRNALAYRLARDGSEAEAVPLRQLLEHTDNREEEIHSLKLVFSQYGGCKLRSVDEAKAFVSAINERARRHGVHFRHPKVDFPGRLSINTPKKGEAYFSLQTATPSIRRRGLGSPCLTIPTGLTIC